MKWSAVFVFSSQSDQAMVHLPATGKLRQQWSDCSLQTNTADHFMGLSKYKGRCNIQRFVFVYDPGWPFEKQSACVGDLLNFFEAYSMYSEQEDCKHDSNKIFFLFMI